MKRLALSALMLAIVVVWGWTFVIVKEAIAAYGVLPFLAVRYAIATVAIGLFAARRVTRASLTTGGLIGLVLAAAYLFQTFGLRLTTPTNSGVITGLFVVFAPVANRLFYGVRTSRLLWGAIGLCVAGLVLLSGGSPDGVAPGDVLTLGAAACFGVHVALLDRHAKHHDASALAFAQVGVAAIVFLLACPMRTMPAWPTRQVWFALVMTGIVATAAAFYVQTFVQQRLPAVQTAMIIVLEPLFAAIFGYWLANDRLTAIQIVGAALMTGAAGVAEVVPLLRQQIRRSGPPQAPPRGQPR